MKAKTVPPFVTGEELGSVLGISSRRVRQLVAEKIIPPAGPDGYPLHAAVQAMLFKARSVEDGTPASKAKARLLEAKAADAEIQSARARRDLVPADGAVLVLTTCAAEIVRVFQSLPARVTRDLALRKRLKTELDQGRREIIGAINKATAASKEL